MHKHNVVDFSDRRRSGTRQDDVVRSEKSLYYAMWLLGVVDFYRAGLVDDKHARCFLDALES